MLVLGFSAFGVVTLLSLLTLRRHRTAIERYDQALEQSPTNVEAMTYRGWVLHTIATGASADQAAQLDAQKLVDEARKSAKAREHERSMTFEPHVPAE